MSELTRTILNKKFTYFTSSGGLILPEILLDAKGIEELEDFLKEIKTIKAAMNNH